jgi:hypothetical protein
MGKDAGCVLEKWKTSNLVDFGSLMTVFEVLNQNFVDWEKPQNSRKR